MKRGLVIFCGICATISVISNYAAASGGVQLADVLVAREGISREMAQARVAEVFAAIQGELESGKSVQIRKFGKFFVQQRKARVGRNPKTGAKIDIPAKRYPKFHSSDVLKAKLNES